MKNLAFFLFVTVTFNIDAQNFLLDEISRVNQKIQSGEVSNKNKEVKIFSRYKQFVIPRIYPNRNALASGVLVNEAAKMNQISFAKSGVNAQWQYIGQTNVPSNGGAGRLNCITFDPLTADNIWVGAPEGGLWQSSNAGLTWSSNSSLPSNIGVTKIVINPLSSNTMYIATGDGYGYPFNNIMWGGKYSNGIMRSDDGGLTWLNTGMNYQISQTMQLHDLILHQTDTSVLVTTTSAGIYFSSNSAKTWTFSVETLEISNKM